MRAQRGMVTVELALISVVVASAAGFALWVIAQLLLLDQCQLVAHQVARQAARGDAAAVNRAVAQAPSGARVDVTDAGGATTVVVRFEVRVAGVSVAAPEARAVVLNEARP